MNEFTKPLLEKFPNLFEKSPVHDRMVAEQQVMVKILVVAMKAEFGHFVRADEGSWQRMAGGILKKAGLVPVMVLGDRVMWAMFNKEGDSNGEVAPDRSEDQRI